MQVTKRPKTPTELLADIKTVDGAGSGLDADTLRGKSSVISGESVWTGPVNSNGVYFNGGAGTNDIPYPGEGLYVLEASRTQYMDRMFLTFWLPADGTGYKAENLALTLFSGTSLGFIKLSASDASVFLTYVAFTDNQGVTSNDSTGFTVHSLRRVALV